MSQYGAPASEDRRPLPPGWIKEWDENYNRWFYVDTNCEPPRSSWEHPLGPPPSRYPHPPGPPPPGAGDRGFDRPYGGSPGYGGGGGYSGYDEGSRGPQSWQNEGYGGSPGGGYGGPPSGGYGGPPGGGYGGPPGGYRPNYGGPPPEEQRGMFGGGPPPPAPYQAGPPPVEVIEAPPKKHHMGLGTAVLAGGAGLLAGGLITSAFEHHEDYERDVAFQEGENAGFGQGENVGFAQGEDVGFDRGEDVGFVQGDNIGFDQGFVDGAW